MIKLANTDTAIAACFPTMKELRTELKQEEFVPLVRELMQEGFQLAYHEDGEGVTCVAGFRIYKNLFLGKHLYVDDLSTLERARSLGLGGQMLAWLRDYAKQQGCNVLHLDSGVQRFRAHKFYLNQGMFISSHHFSQKLD